MANANPAAPAAQAQRQSIEFVVKPTEELYLEGGLRRLPRVHNGYLFLVSFKRFLLI